MVKEQADRGVDRLVGWRHRRVRGTAGLQAGGDRPTGEVSEAGHGGGALCPLGAEGSVLRYHRADAHAAAWQAAGLTSAAIRQMAAGPARDAIEVETNR